MRVPVRIAIGQINPTVGDLAGNRDLMTRFAVRAAEAGVGLVVFPDSRLCSERLASFRAASNAAQGREAA
jgi:NAD+ synthase (glutamine-hydrolysing)